MIAMIERGGMVLVHEPGSSSPELPISACIITLNEEENIRRCLESVQWADEKLVVDSGSDDETVAIARSLGARVLHNDWPGYRRQKQYATDHARHDWIFSIDADEEVSTTLQSSVCSTFHSTPDPDRGFMVNRKCYFLGQWIEHGSWYPDWILRLFNRRRTEWVGGALHERLRSPDSTVRLDGNLYHYPYRNIAENVAYGNYYSGIQSEELSEQGTASGIFTSLGHGVYKFVKDYVLKQGFRDGMPGLVIATIGAFNVFLKYAKTWEKNNTDAGEDLEYPR